MDAEEIFDKLDNARERLLATIEPLPDEALLAPGVMGDWSILDILDHLTLWESELVTALMQIDQGGRPERLLEAYGDVDGYNARAFAANQGREPDQVFYDLHGVRRELEGWMEEFDVRDLNDAKRYPWASGRALSEIIEENSFGHELEHLPDIKAFAAGWLATHEGNADLDQPEQDT